MPVRYINELGPDELPSYIDALVKQAVKEAIAAEREACAKIAETLYGGPLSAKEIAAAIRARGSN